MQFDYAVMGTGTTVVLIIIALAIGWQEGRRYQAKRYRRRKEQAAIIRRLYDGTNNKAE